MFMKARSKNKSQKYPNGTIVQTRDEYLQRKGASRITPYTDRNHVADSSYYRTTVVVDSNRDDELALVKKTTHGGKSPKGTFSDFVEVFNFEDEPIKIGKYFKTKRGKRISKKETSELRKRLFKTGFRARSNRFLVRKYIKKR